MAGSGFRGPAVGVESFLSIPLPALEDLRRLVAIRVEAVGGLLIVSVLSVDEEDPWRWRVSCEVVRTHFPFCIARSSRTGLSVAPSVA